MANDVVTAFLEHMSELEKGEHCAEQVQGLLELWQNMGDNLPAKLPSWLTAATIKRFFDVEEVISVLPQLIRQCYNHTKASVYVFAPDAALTRMGAQTLEGKSIRKDCSVRFIYVKNDGSVPQEEISDACAILICPSRFHSGQFAAISHHFPSAEITALDLYEADDWVASVRKNDVSRFDFLRARWEIEAEPAVKQKRLQELLEQFKVMLEVN